MTKIVVLGSNSFSGQDFISLVAQETDWEITGISRSLERGPVFNRYLLEDTSRFRFHQLDLNQDIEAIGDLLHATRPRFVVNFAAQSEVAPSWESPWDWYQTNVVALSRLTSRLLSEDWLEKYVHISSPEVYGTTEGTVREDHRLDPTTPYAASKAAADLHLATLVKNFDFPLAWIRSTNVYGPGQQLHKIIPRSFIHLKTNRKIPLHGGGVAVKSYIHIRDVSRGELEIVRNSSVFGGWHLSPHEGSAVKDVVRLCCEVWGRDFESSTEVVDERLGQDRAYVVSSAKARALLDWHPGVSLPDGIAEVGRWVSDNWSAISVSDHEYRHRP